MKIQELAAYLGATLHIPEGQEELVNADIVDLAPIDTAGNGHVTFLTNPRLTKQVEGSKASAIILGQALKDAPMAQIICKNPRLAMSLASQLFYKAEHSYEGRSKMAFLHPSAEIHESVVIYPFAYVGERASIGKGCYVYPNAYIGEDCHIGEGCVIYPGAVLMQGTQVGRNVIVHAGAVLGGDGFGFTPSADGNVKIPQKGTVLIEDDCEIGPLATIDRATFAQTVVKRGTKLDSQVHIGHNVEVGEHSMLCGQAGVAGSTKIGKRFVAAGQAAIGPGLEIGDHVVLGPRAGMTQSQKNPGEYMGMPVVPAQDWRKQAIAIKKLPDLIKKVNQLEKRLAELS
ncbi:MAG: UDP-3-O-(3-hydroxymyristoyl)glucosamine N-acyltransferase [Oligoflexales bacterium]|nr:UDP-3-O-(3-hydroxymyristoyl)glucosamine N-acyltransferase [Oligoflexales bacterium]